MDPEHFFDKWGSPERRPGERRGPGVSRDIRGSKGGGTAVGRTAPRNHDDLSLQAPTRICRGRRYELLPALVAAAQSAAVALHF